MADRHNLKGREKNILKKERNILKFKDGGRGD
jgi:hypothetical protein